MTCRCFVVYAVKTFSPLYSAAGGDFPFIAFAAFPPCFFVAVE